MDKVKNTSVNSGYENLDKLRRVFPQFVKENKIDFEALNKFFKDEEMVAGEEKYGLNWAGKSNAFKLIRTPSVGTLTPQEKESKDWDKTENLFIEGDNLEVLKLLQKHYREKIKMIYIDPPYNTGKDFIYKDNYTENISDYYEKTGQSKNGIKMTTNPESAGRYHSDWLTMMYPRLFLARNLLKEDGVIFISIDDNEVANLRLIMDEIFGEENFIGCAARVAKKSNNKGDFWAPNFDYVLTYTKYRELAVPFFGGVNYEAYNLVETEGP
ncbi:MAG: site-specific DNA-methyltransferase, partial [Patescibacteria group bacterium]